MISTRTLILTLVGVVGALTIRVRQLRGRIEWLEEYVGMLADHQLDHLVSAHDVPDPRTTNLKVLKNG